MLMDGRLLFSDAQGFTSTGTYISDYVVQNPTGKDVWGTAKNQDPGEGGGLFLHVAISTAFTSISGLTSVMSIKLQDSVSATSGSFSDLLTLAASKKVVSLAAGKEWVMGIPFDYNNFLRTTYVVAEHGFSAGAIDAWISVDPTLLKAKY